MGLGSLNSESHKAENRAMPFSSRYSDPKIPFAICAGPTTYSLHLRNRTRVQESDFRVFRIWHVLYRKRKTNPLSTVSAKSPSQSTSTSKAILLLLRTGRTTHPPTYEALAQSTPCRDQSLTLSQNYRRLGLSSRLNAYTGGTEAKTKSTLSESRRKDTLSIPTSHRSSELGTSEVKVTRDPTTGAITSVQHEKSERENPLRDPLNDFSDPGDEEAEESSGWGIVPELEEQARYSRPKRPRMQSQREREWVERLVERWGDDWGGMFRDRKLNPQQQSEGDLKKRVGVWKSGKRKGQEEGEGGEMEVS